MRTTLFALLLAGACCVTAVGADPRFSAHTTEKVFPAVPLLKLGADDALELAGPAGVLATGKLVELHQEAKARPAWLTDHFVQLAHGDCVPLDPVAPVRLVEGRLNVIPADRLTGELSLYRPYLNLFFITLPDGVDDPELFLARLRKETRARDVVYLRSGDRIEGTVVVLDPEHGCEIDAEGRKLHVRWDRLAGVAWNTARQARPRLRASVGHAVLDDGARLNLTQLHFEPATRRWAGKTWFGAPIDLAVERLVALDVWHGPAVYLSDLVGQYEHVPYLSVTWPLGLDAAASGGPLSVGGAVFDKGLGMHGASRVSYALDGGYRWFEAVAGLDTRAGGRGRGRLAVLVDGRRQELGAKEWRAADGPLPIRIDVRAARVLTIVVENGAFGDVQAHVNWCNARLVKQ